MASEKKLSVNPPKLLNSSESLTVPQQTVAIALSNFYTKIGGLPAEPWGDDEIGHKFYAEYTGQNDPDGGRAGGYLLVLESIAGLLDGLENMADKTKALADFFIKTENTNVDML